MRILIIEDDEQLTEALKIQLEHNGFQTDCSTNGMEALHYAVQAIYDVIILDRMLPGMDGLTVLKLLRENQIQTPVIMATAIDSVPERIAGLDCGADDYIVKPYDVGELLARIRALQRRPISLENTACLTFDDLSFQPKSNQLSCHSAELQLSRRESVLIEYFIKNAGQTLSRQLIYTRVWGPDGEVEDGNLDTYIYYLRKHLRTLNSRVRITTVHGIGYRLEKIK